MFNMNTKRLSPGQRRRASARHSARTWCLTQPLRDRGLTWMQVADTLNRQGSRTFSGRLWSPSRLCQVAAVGGVADILFQKETEFGFKLID